MDLIDRDALYVAFMDSGLDGVQLDNLMEINQIVDEAPSAPINYEVCSNAMLRMWMEKVLTDSEYNRIMDKLNKAHRDGLL